MKPILENLFAASMVIFFCAPDEINGQTPDFAWAQRYGAASQEEPLALCTDSEGNVLTTGYFTNSFDFDPGAGTTMLTSAGGPDIFVSKTNSDGELVWAFGLGGAFQEKGEKIVSDASGNVFVSGYFNGTVDFDPGAGVHNLTSTLYADLFIAKYDSDGNFLWAGNFAGGSNVDGNGLVLDQSGNLFVTGYFQGTQDFDPNASVYQMTASVSQDGFLLKLNNDGNFLWAKQFSGSFACYVEDICIDRYDDVTLTGNFQGTFDFDPNAGLSSLTAVGGNDAFVVKLNSAGDFEWAKQFTGPSEIFATAVATDSAGYIYSTGQFEGTVDFDPSTSYFGLASAGASDVYVSKLNPEGEYLWAKKVGGPDIDQSADIQVDENNHVVIAGSFRATTDLDPNSGDVIHSSNGLFDLFILSLQSDGLYDWSESFGSIVADNARAIGVDPNGSIFLAGIFQYNVDFNFGTEAFVLNSAGSYDAFTMKYSYCSPVHSVISVVECKSYTSPSGFYTWNTSGVYSDTLTSVTGCDSILTINLTINVVNIDVVQTDDALNIVQSGAIYQWLDCNDDFAELTGETSQNFVPSVSGTFAASVSYEGCIDTTECYMIENPASVEDFASVEVNIFPNPSTDGVVNVRWESGDVLEILIFNSTGQTVQRFQVEEGQQALTVGDLTPGSYLVSIGSDNGSTVREKLIVM